MLQPGSTEDDRYTLESKPDDNLFTGNNPAQLAKRERVKQALMRMLPPFDQLSKSLTTNSEWWHTWRRKCSGTSEPGQSLLQFAVKALTAGNIPSIGTVVLSLGICSNDEEEVERYMETIDRWVLADDEYAASLEGIELLLLKAKWFADVGQPRRAWLCNRKGLLYAQLMVCLQWKDAIRLPNKPQGLHRKRTTSPAQESIWWALYHGDRFISLLLGLPYGISDSHCDLTMPVLGNSEYMHPLAVMTKISQLAGRVIDRNQGIAEQSFAWALQLDQEMEDVWKKLDPAWLDYSDLIADPEGNAAELRERLMGQMVFHQIRVYLHLPFMLKSTSNSRFTYSRTACLNGSREVLRLYQALRIGAVQPLYECKAVDFIGFTAAILIQIGLLNFATKGDSNAQAMNPKDIEDDIRSIEISIDIFRRASSEKGGKVALQSAEILEKLMGKFKGGNDEQDDLCGDATSYVIPYFGTISIKRGGRPIEQGHKIPKPRSLTHSSSSTSNSARSPAPPQIYTPNSDKVSRSTGSELYSRPTQSLNVTPKSSISAGTGSTAFNLSNSTPFVSYDGFYNWDNLNSEDGSVIASADINTQINDDSMNNFPLPTNNFSWQQMPMDIDQDWSWFMNDAQTNQAVGTGMADAAQSVPFDAFNTQGFPVFG